MGNANSIGENIGDAALGAGVGAGEYELAKRNPNAFFILQLIGVVAFIIVVVVIVVLVVNAKKTAQKEDETEKSE